MLAVTKQRPRLLCDLPPDLRKVIEHVQVDARGNVVPQLYSKLQANAERLSDAELIAQLSDMAKEIEIDLNYQFAQKSE